MSLKRQLETTVKNLLERSDINKLKIKLKQKNSIC